MVPGSLPSLPLSGGVLKTPTFPVLKVLGAHAFVLHAFLVHLFLTTRILARDTPFSVDLSVGNSIEGTKVELRERWKNAHQIWTVLNRNWCVEFHKPVVLVLIAKSSSVRAAVSEEAGSDNEVSIVDDPAKTSTVTGSSKGIRKTKLASVVKDRGYSNESFFNPEEGQVAFRELEVRIKAWSAQGWRIGEDMRRLREFLYEDA
jgi:hypothetical protein